MTDRTIEAIIDTHLQKWADAGINQRPGPIDKEMAGPTNKEGWTQWHPIPSKVTDSEIEDFEEQIGHRLPSDYKRFLKHKHFYDLYISEASFTHLANTWRTTHMKLIYGGYPREFLIDKGYLPFADWNDWGMLCFDTNADDGKHNYPVVMWDHDRPYQVKPMYRDFTDLIQNLDRQASEKELEEQ